MIDRWTDVMNTWSCINIHVYSKRIHHVGSLISHLSTVTNKNAVKLISWHWCLSSVFIQESLTVASLQMHAADWWTDVMNTLWLCITACLMLLWVYVKWIVIYCRLLIVAGDCETICDVLLDIIPMLDEASATSAYTCSRSGVVPVSYNSINRIGFIWEPMTRKSW